MKLLGFATILMATMIPLAHADVFHSGNSIYENCGSQDSVRHAYCAWYVVGVVDGLLSIQSILQRNLGFCLSGNVSQKQVIDVVIKYLTDNPSTRNYAAASEILRAMQLAFPCR